MREQLLRQVEDGLQSALDAAARAGLQRDEVVKILDGLLAEHDAVEPAGRALR
jgi:GntR family transcriptional regulator